MTRWMTTVALAAVLAACGSEAPAPVEGDPIYSITGNVLFCDAPTNRTNDAGPPRVATCHWDCTPYKGQAQRYVTLTFTYDGAVWHLAQEYVIAGLC